MLKKTAFIFPVGCIGYSLIEIWMRGYTHWTMTLLGGICLLSIAFVFEEFAQSPLILQAAMGTIVVTAAEFCTGLVINLLLGWSIWDYTGEPGNFLGQICPRFSFYWFMLCYALLSLAHFAKYMKHRLFA